MPSRIVGFAVLALGIAAVVLAAARAEQQLNALNFAAFDDWRTYANAVDRWLGGGEIYAAEQVAGPYQLRDTLRTGFTYPPAAVPLFAPFSFGTVGLVAWVSVNLGAFLLGLFAILRRELGGLTPVSAGLTLLAAAGFPPFSNAIVSGNLNLGIAGLLAWMWVVRGGSVTPALAGLGGVLKIFPGLMTVWPARHDGLRSFAIAIAVTLGLALTSVPLVGVGAWVDFASALRNAQPECAPQSISFGCSLAGVVGSEAARLVGFGLALVLAYGALRIASPFVAYAALGAALLAPVVDMHPHYWLIAWVVAFVGVARAVARMRRRRTDAVRG